MQNDGAAQSVFALCAVFFSVCQQECYVKVIKMNKKRIKLS